MVTPASGAAASTPMHPCAGRSSDFGGAISWPVTTAMEPAATNAAISQPDGTWIAENSEPSVAVGNRQQPQ